MRYLLVVGLLASLLVTLAASSVSAAPEGCEFVLGFKSLHDRLPNVVGDCKTSEYHNPQNGDGLQETTRGLTVWRKADNFTAFTDGYRTWVAGPVGIQQRLNTERFEWERRGGADDPATHDLGDDKGGLRAPGVSDDPATHDVGDDKGGLR